MDRFTGFIIFAVVLVVEQMAAQAWFGPYFRFGLPIYFRRVKSVPPEEPAGWVDPTGSNDPAESNDPAGSNDPVGENDPTGSRDPVEPVDPEAQQDAAAGQTEAARPARTDPGFLTARYLQASFKSRANLPTIRFKAISTSAVALRAAMFEGRGGLRYLPVIHSIIRLPETGRPVLTGYIDWYVLFTLYYLFVTSQTDRSFVIVAVLVLVIFVVSYITQVAVNNQVAEELGKMG